MKRLAFQEILDNKQKCYYVDFVCPTKHTREDFSNRLYSMDGHNKEGRFEDTNKMFEEPDSFDFKVTHKDKSLNERI